MHSASGVHTLRTLSGELKGYRQFFTALLSIAGPIMLQNLLISSLSFVDMLMIGNCIGAEQMQKADICAKRFMILSAFGGPVHRSAHGCCSAGNSPCVHYST